MSLPRSSAVYTGSRSKSAASLRVVVMAFALGAALAGCSSLPDDPIHAGSGQPISVAAVLDDQAYSERDRARVPDAAAVFALDSDMTALLELKLQPALRRGHSFGAVLEALSREGRLQLDYDNARTLTAAEAFASRRGNCLSLVVMTAAFAHALGLEIEYQHVDNLYDWEHQDDLTFIVGHVNLRIARDRPTEPFATGNLFNEGLVVDFLRGEDLRHQSVTVIPRKRVLAMFYNNRAAEALSNRGLDEAYAYARAAVLSDPDFAPAYNTLGIIHDRKGLGMRAQTSWRAALQREPETSAATDNLALWLRKNGQGAAAQSLLAQSAKTALERPLQLLSDARLAMAGGDQNRALALLNRALRFSPRHHELHFTLAQAHAQLGNVAQSARHLELAQQHAGNAPLQARYAGKLQRLRELQSL